MQLHGSTNTQNVNPITRQWLLRTMSVAMAACLVAVAGLSLSGTVTAATDDGPRGCSNRTLRGDYGILVSGIRGLGPGVRESFVGTALRTYDGRGPVHPDRQRTR